MPVVSIPTQTVKVDTPTSVDLSNVPVTNIPTQKVTVETPSSVDLSQVPVVSIPTQKVMVDKPTSVDLSNVPVTNIAARAIKVTTPQSVDLSGVPVTLPQAKLDVAVPTSFDLSGVPVTLPDATQDVKYNFPDAELLPPIDLGGLRFINLPPFLRTGPTTGNEKRKRATNPSDPPISNPPRKPDPNDLPPDPPAVPPEPPVAEDPRLFEERGRRAQQSRDARGTPQTGITSTDITKSIKEGNQQANESSGLHNLPSTIAEGIQKIAGAIISSGAIGVGTGGAREDTGGFGDLDTGKLADDFAKELGNSFRSDVIPTLLGNPAVTVNPGGPDPDPVDDDEVGQAPAAPRSTAAAFSAVTDLLSLEALANVAQEKTQGDLRAILANFETSGIPIRVGTDSEDIFGGFNFEDLNPINLLKESAANPIHVQNTEGNPLYVKAEITNEKLPVEVTNESLQVNINGQLVKAQIVGGTLQIDPAQIATIANIGQSQIDAL